MGRPTFVLPLALALLAAAGHRSAAQNGTPVGSGNPFDGEWTLRLSIATAPGGVSARWATPFNCQYLVENRRFEVKADGSFEWLVREAGAVHDDGISPGGSFRNDFRLHLRGRGKAELPPETGGPERPDDRSLNLRLSLLGGDGRGSAVSSGRLTFSIGVASADLTQMTFTSYPGGHVVTVSGVPHEVTWPELRSTSVAREELAPDVILERTIYRASRQGTMRAPEEIPVTERIEVQHLRYRNLVPRG